MAGSLSAQLTGYSDQDTAATTLNITLFMLAGTTFIYDGITIGKHAVSLSPELEFSLKATSSYICNVDMRPTQSGKVLPPVCINRLHHKMYVVLPDGYQAQVVA